MLVRSPVDSSDLCVGADNYVAGRNRILPVIGVRQIGLDDPDVGMQSSQDRGVGGVFVDRNNVSVMARLETRDQVLADETGRAGNGDAWRHPLPLQIFSRWKTKRGRCRMIIMIGHQNQGV